MIDLTRFLIANAAALREGVPSADAKRLAIVEALDGRPLAASVLTTQATARLKADLAELQTQVDELEAAAVPGPPEDEIQEFIDRVVVPLMQLIQAVCPKFGTDAKLQLEGLRDRMDGCAAQPPVDEDALARLNGFFDTLLAALPAEAEPPE